ncbi:hypothetical protein KC330_g4515 [Hortaea werneckii]|nr:hypothetical protein KC330_g4515 [Hortaea werneckii]
MVTTVCELLPVETLGWLPVDTLDEVPETVVVTVVLEALLVEPLGWLPVDTLDEVSVPLVVTVVLGPLLVELLGWLPLDALDEVPEAVTVTVVLERLFVEPLGVDEELGIGVDELLTLKDDEREGDELAVTVTVVRELLPDEAADEEGEEGPLDVESDELPVELFREEDAATELELLWVGVTVMIVSVFEVLPGWLDELDGGLLVVKDRVELFKVEAAPDEVAAVALVVTVRVEARLEEETEPAVERDEGSMMVAVTSFVEVRVVFDRLPGAEEELVR